PGAVCASNAGSLLLANEEKHDQHEDHRQGRYRHRYDLRGSTHSWRPISISPQICSYASDLVRSSVPCRVRSLFRASLHMPAAMSARLQAPIHSGTLPQRTLSLALAASARTGRPTTAKASRMKKDRTMRSNGEPTQQ